MHLSCFPILIGLIDAGFDSLSLVYLTLLAYYPFILGGVYSLNFYSDKEADSESDKEKDVKMSNQPFATGEVGKKEGMTLFYCCMLLD